MKSHLGFCVFAVLVAACASAPAPAPVVYLVRHAETEGGGSDPSLSAAGRARAEELGRILASAGIERILTTDYRRTRETVAPLARRLGIEPEIYDPRSLDAVAAEIRRKGRRALVAGHSNTTPALVAALGGDPHGTIAESEYDRLYRIELSSGSTAMERYAADPR